jgi:acetyl-CoA carboxylase biotin carboxyl carrier protein
MESSDYERIKRVVDAFERSDWSEIDVRTGDLRVHLSAGGGGAPRPDQRPDQRPADRPGVDGPTAGTTSATAATLASTDASDVRAATDRSQTSDHPTIPAAAAVDEVHDGHVVASPTPGIFWRSPEPGAPPFAEVGATVESSDTLCIIEVMKLMNHLKAGVRGRLVAVHGENGVAVAKDAPLFTIVPDETVS